MSRLDRIEKILEELSLSQIELKESQKITTEQIRELKESQKITTEEIRELKESQKKTEEMLKNLSREVGRVTDSLGRFVEGLIEPSLKKYFKEKGFKIIRSSQRVKVSRDGKNAEYDGLFIIEEKVAVIVSAKSFATSRSVDELLKDMEEFSFFNPEYKGYDLIGAIAGMNFGEGADVYALRKGLLVLKPSEETMCIEEPQNLKILKV